jgi:hypothetical protein
MGAASAPEASDQDVRWELVIRIAESQRFAKSLRLREFLLYVCRAALDRHVDEISEQKIGERVFHRSPDYNPNEDNIVRSQARLLRQKLEAYFSTEGADEPLVLRIPKGGYVPEFIERGPESPAIQPVAMLAPEPDRTRPDRLNVVPWLVGAVAVLSFAVALLVIALVRARPTTPAGTGSHVLNALWSQLLSDKIPTTIVIPDHTFALLQEAAREPEDLQSYLRRSVPGSAAAAGRPGKEHTLLDLFPRFASRRYTTFDGVTTAVRVLQLAEKFQSRVMVRYARDLTLRDLSPGNAILIGRPTTNLWTQLFESKLNFRPESDLANHRFVVRNTSPQPGEPSEFVPKFDGGRFEAYSSISFIRNLNGGNVLIIGGAASSSQEGAADFITSDKLLTQLSEKIERDGHLPYFDALLRTVTIDGMSQEPSLVSYRVLEAR